MQEALTENEVDSLLREVPETASRGTPQGSPFNFTTEDEPYKQISVSLPVRLINRIQGELKALKQSRTERVEYLIEYAYDAGSLNRFIDLMANQYADQCRQLAEIPETSSYAQVDRLREQVCNLENTVRGQQNTIQELVDVMKGVSVTIVQLKQQAEGKV